MKNLLLSSLLIAVPVAGFAATEAILQPPTASASIQATAPSGLGDLSAYAAIVSDTRMIASTGDLVAAERRITDLETLWDDNAATLRKADPHAWNVVDAAADAAFSSLRALTPDKAKVVAALSALQEALRAPVPAAESQPLTRIAGIAVTDDSGRALPCEVLIGTLRDRLAGTTPSAEVGALQSKALERCNADDDARADVFAAQALSMIKG